MREIKFRAWQPFRSLHRKPGMYEVSDIAFYPANGGGEAFLALHGEESKSSEYLEDIHLMQYTGLKDKNGVEIYEGDLLSSDHTTNARNAPQIVAYSMLPVHGDYQESYGYTFDYRAEELEIVGNIYENPELLKDSNVQS